jgi:hypothetical protein
LKEYAASIFRMHTYRLENLKCRNIRVVKSRRLRWPEPQHAWKEHCVQWEDNIKTDLKEIGYEDVDWIH